MRISRGPQRRTVRRVAIARAAAGNPLIIPHDELTAALDSTSEHAVIEPSSVASPTGGGYGQARSTRSLYTATAFSTSEMDA